MNLGSLGQDNIQKFGKYESVYYEGKWYTNVEMEMQSNRPGNALKSLGIQREVTGWPSRCPTARS